MSIYVLDIAAMVDPDAPSRENPRAAQWNHWLVTNVDGEQLLSKKIICKLYLLVGATLKAGSDLDGKVLMKYNGPSPPKASGIHNN